MEGEIATTGCGLMVIVTLLLLPVWLQASLTVTAYTPEADAVNVAVLPPIGEPFSVHAYESGATPPVTALVSNCVDGAQSVTGPAGVTLTTGGLLETFTVVVDVVLHVPLVAVTV